MTINLLKLSPAPCFLAKQADSKLILNDEHLSRTNVTFYGRVERNNVAMSFLQMIVIESPSVSSCRDAGCPSKLNTSANFDCLFFVLKSDGTLPTHKKPPQTDQRVYAKIICHMTGTDVANDLQKMILQDGSNDILTLQDSSLQNTENLTTLLSNNHLVYYHFNKNSTYAKLTAYLPVVQDSHTAYRCLAETKQNLSRVVSGTITSNRTSHNVTPGPPAEFSKELNSADSKWKIAVVILSLLLAIVVVVVAVAVIFCKRKKCVRVCQQENVENNDEDNRNSLILNTNEHS